MGTLRVCVVDETTVCLIGAHERGRAVGRGDQRRDLAIESRRLQARLGGEPASRHAVRLTGKRGRDK